MVAIADGKPHLMGLQEILDHYIKHQKNVTTRRIQYDLDKARAREHILEGLIIAVHNIDEVIAIIRSSKNPRQARERLVQAFELTEIQAQAILDMRLQRLTNMEIANLEKEYNQIQKLIKEYEAILASEKLLIKLIKKELLEIKKKYSSERRTDIVEDGTKAEIKTEDLIYVEDVVVTLTHNQDIKRIPIKAFNRSSRDVEVVDTREMDYIEFLVDSSTDHKVLLLTDQGNCYSLNCSDIPEGKWKDKGVQLLSLLSGFDRTERVVSLISVKEFSDDLFIQFYTRGGMVKKTSLSEYEARKSKILACGLKKNDRVIGAELTYGTSDILVVTSHGMSIRFHGSDVSAMGRTAKGVKAVQLKNNDHVVTGMEIDDEGELVVITDRGFGKRTLISDYQAQGRGGVGFKTFTFYKNQANGTRVISAFYTKEPYEIILQQKDGTSTRFSTDDLPIHAKDGRGKSLAIVVMDNETVYAYRNFN
jgi:DNA gyrase/topoisomerase IV subunit A